jgi:hypothetical protein
MIKLEIEGMTDPFATVRTQDGDSCTASVEDGTIDCRLGPRRGRDQNRRLPQGRRAAGSADG